MAAKPKFVFDLSGGELCLDFVNTVDHRRSPQELIDNLPNYPELLSFAAQTGILSPADRAFLERAAARNLAAARRVLHEAVELREAICRTFTALIEGRQPPAEDVHLLNQQAHSALRHMRLQAAPGGFRWQWQAELSLDAPLWKIAKSAADLLTTEDAHSVRECAAENCGWLFVDRSRNHARRWCDMKTCGNRVKAQRHYQRAKSLLTSRARRAGLGAAEPSS